MRSLILVVIISLVTAISTSPSIEIKTVQGLVKRVLGEVILSYLLLYRLGICSKVQF